MVKIQESFDVGIIVGRFQVDELTDGHKKLIDSVQADHKRVIVFLGLSPCKCTVNNPLDFEARKLMLQEAYPDIEVYYIHDTGSDVQWSDALDGMVLERTSEAESVCLYGGRDSFLQYYSGGYPCKELVQDVFTSGTEKRKQLATNVNKSRDFRHGVIWATMNQWPACLPTVDIAIFNNDRSRILLGKKKNEGLYRFIGGFGEPNETFETTAIRETKEEANIDVQSIQYVRSFVVSDWRYKSEVNKITTSLFEVTKWSGNPAPGDDIDELRWFPFNTHLLGSVVVEHREMLDCLLNR
jgi:bifunctional NMN adenylyltransferase/nudix hydrolase